MSDLPELPKVIVDALGPTRPVVRPACLSFLLPQRGPLHPHRGYVDAALDDEVKRVASAMNGTRNDALNTAAFSMARLVAGGEIAETKVCSALGGVAAAVGLNAGEIEKTLDSAFRAGWENPRRAPDRQAAAIAKKARIEDKAEEAAKGIKATPFVWKDPTKIPPREWVYGHHLIRRFLSTTVAPGGVGKSSLTIAEAIAIAVGRPILDVPVYGGPKRVWLWNLEDPNDELDRRFMATCLHFNVTATELGDRLYVDSGRIQKLCTAVQDKTGTRILKPVTDALVAELKARQIDVLIVDPFVSSHSVPENDNGAIDAVAKEWARIADRANCAIELVHHTKKLGGAEATAEASRGAIALVNAARDARAINRMGSDLAAKYGLENDRLYFRVISDKGNLAPPPDKSDWYHLASVDLGNGDNVGVVERWIPPDLTAGFTVDDLKAVQKAVAAGSWRENIRSPEWVGNAVANALELDLGEPPNRKRIKAMLALWLREGVLMVVEKKDEKRMPRTFVEVGEWA